MSSISGDSARFHRERKRKIARRERNRELRKALKAAALAKVSPVIAS